MVAFGATLQAPFYLDDWAIFNDPVITSPSGWWQCFEMGQTRPLTWFSFWLNYQLGGGYHAVNLGLHLANVWIAGLVLARLLPGPAALLATALFALHPIQTEAVAYVFARATLLMTFFCLLCLRDWTRQRHGRAIFWFALALMAKEECVTFPLVLLLLHFSISRNTKEFRYIGGMLVLSMAFGIRVLWATATVVGSGAGAQAGIGPIDYLATQGLAILRYLRLVAIPVGFAFESPLEVGAYWFAWLPILASAVVATTRFSKARAGFWWLAALLILAPSSTILPAQDLSADRRMYLAMVAFGGFVSVLLPAGNKILTYGIALALTMLSFLQAGVWRDPVRLWQQAIEAAPRKVRPRIQLARLLPPAEAIRILNEAQSFAPREPNLASEKGRVLLESGDPQNALAEFGSALALAPGDARAVNNRGVALQRLGQTEAAKTDFERALQMEPCLFDAQWNLRKLGYTGTASARCRFTPEQRRSLDGR